ncbi:sulfite exporter TauE/SafE family protein [Pseudonocardia halophobica]|uniref:Probable membrane transporter protein n=1 Tax=Pseudonocardia halophobica TaxID=29401 RepID=A0A9W6KZM6_9PSEU|nr:sulfite exporter TauE/SafE family protein [Pseudonocardia halophobica]GLL09514.1 UPF0721 transmembrane protein [Pseudonocardia halophobica]
MIVLAALLGLVMGAVIGGLGGGGGVLTVPALVYLLGQPAQAATTASVVIVGVTATVGVIARARSGGVDWRTGVMFGVVGIPAAWLGTALNRRVDQPTLMLAFAGLTLVAAMAMLLDARGRRRAAEHAATDPTGDEADGPGGTATAPASDPGTAGTALATERRSRAGPLLATAAKVAVGGASVGFLTGFLGVGGGFLVVPVLVIMLRMPMTLAIGTSLLIIALNSVSSMVSRLGALHLDWRVVVPFTLAAVVGTLLGKRISDRLSGRTLGIAFAWLLVAVGLFVGVRNLLAL